MLDIKLIREEPELVKKSSKNRGYDENIVNEVLKIDEKWRKLKKQDDSLRGDRNKVSQEINKLKKEKKESEANKAIKKAKEIANKISSNEEKERKLYIQIKELVSQIPNIQGKEIPIGDETKNKELSKSGTIPKFKFKVRSHSELLEDLDLLDMKRGAKIAGSGFYLLKGKLAQLQRALIQFFLDFHIKDGFTEINPPQLVNTDTMFNTGNLPKFEDDLYKTREGNYLIPTAEVPVTNLHANETLNEKDLPKKYCAFTQCYRTEAGRHTGEEGLFRVHQFEKVEMVYISNQEDSWDILEEMTKRAEKLIEMLEIPYRRILLATADASFASAKTYDLEVWSPAMKKYLEASSCSNCTDFQARRMNTRYQSKQGMKFTHTLNGSGLALTRLMIALIENNQQEDGS
ncbi:MAG: serine--tRNA ligase, partial [Nanoarchaeota archaeon]|nr:serine--tRNA ligase [Nanoarchaeota archaeon]